MGRLEKNLVFIQVFSGICVHSWVFDKITECMSVTHKMLLPHKAGRGDFFEFLVNSPGIMTDPLRERHRELQGHPLSVWRSSNPFG
jgi:hypothetical protein